MRKVASLLAIIGLALPVLTVSPAQAVTPTETWVSGNGTNSGNCARSAPCATFAYALTQVAAGGEIICVDGGDFGEVAITVSVAISCGAANGSVLVSNSNGIGISINAASTDVVTLRGLNIDGLGVGGDGIIIQSAKEVHIENCQIRNFRGTPGMGILLNGNSTIYVYVVDTVISDNSNGVELVSTGGFKVASLKNVVITGSTNDGVQLGNSNIYVNITESIISGNSGNAVNVLASGSTANIDRTTMANNAVSALNAASGATIRTIGNNIFNNTAAFLIAAGGTIATDQQNRVDGNGGAQVPNAVLTLQ